MALQEVDRNSLPMVQGIRGYLIYGEFKNSNKLTKSQSAFYYHFALAILNNSNFSLLGLIAPTQPPLLGPPLVPVLSIL